jgi:ATP-binding cassette subfamily E protein 1
MKSKVRRKQKEDEEIRIAIIKSEKCKPKKCNLECARYCPVNRGDKICVIAKKTAASAAIEETMCIGCGICIKKCPFDAINIIKLPSGVGNKTTHRFGPNRFVLYKLPTPRIGSVLGLVGTNGIGKTTALKILTNKMKPNLGNFDRVVDWEDIIADFKGSEIQQYFENLLKNSYKSAFKMQFVDKIPKILNGVVGEIIRKKDQRGLADKLVPLFQLEGIMTRKIGVLSGGELQRFAILLTLLQDVNIYVFDEPTSYLDVKQRLMISNAIRDYTRSKDKNIYTMVVEHDLSILDYMSDHICCLFGKAAAFGVVSMPYSVKEGINVFLDGFLPKENIRLREDSIDFKISDQSNKANAEGKKLSPEEEKKKKEKEDANKKAFSYPDVEKRFKNFRLQVKAGTYSSSEIIVLLGENGTGKTTFVRILGGIDKKVDVVMPELKVSFKPQTITPKFNGTVGDLLYKRLNALWEKNILFKTHVFDPMMVKQLFNYEVKKLSGGELQRVGLVVSLGKAAQVYLIDEPSAYLDVEQRIVTAKCIKKFILLMYKTAFIVEHDFIMASYLADKFIVYEGTPGRDCVANPPMDVVEGMNKFLKILGITFRRDTNNYRPRINKMNSALDREQKDNGTYFYIER